MTFYIYHNGEFYYISRDTHYKHGHSLKGLDGNNWWPDAESAREQCDRLEHATHMTVEPRDPTSGSPDGIR